MWKRQWSLVLLEEEEILSKRSSSVRIRALSSECEILSSEINHAIYRHAKFSKSLDLFETWFYRLSGGSAVKNLQEVQEMQETQVWFMGQEESLEECMATPTSMLVKKMPWTEEPHGLRSMGSQRVGHNWRVIASILCRFARSRLTCFDFSLHYPNSMIALMFLRITIVVYDFMFSLLSWSIIASMLLQCWPIGSDL